MLGAPVPQESPNDKRKTIIAAVLVVAVVVFILLYFVLWASPFNPTDRTHTLTSSREYGEETYRFTSVTPGGTTKKTSVDITNGVSCNLTLLRYKDYEQFSRTHDVALAIVHVGNGTHAEANLGQLKGDPDNKYCWIVENFHVNATAQIRYTMVTGGM